MTDKQNDYEMLAMAYLTGQATPEETFRFERLLANDASFAALVREMEAFLAPLNEEVEPRTPPAGLFDDILTEINAHPDTERKASTGPMPWRAIAVFTSTIAIVATALHFVPLGIDTTPDEQQYVAVMADNTAPEVVVIIYDPHQRKVLAQLSNTELPDNGVWQLWLIREGEPAPRSLGLFNTVDEGKHVAINLTEELSAGSDTLALSLEPTGGSPEEGPTGPILYTGHVSEIAL